MIRNYFKVAYRHLLRNKSISLINISGLVVGITAFLVIIQYVSFELSFDQFHENKEQLYRVAYERYENGELKTASAQNFVGIPTMLHEQFPEVEASTGFGRTAAEASFIFAYAGKTYYEPGAFHQTDSNFFKVFPSMLIKGDPSSVLRDMHDLVISEKVARKIFGDVDPIGKKLENKSPSYSDVSDFVVTGVLKDMPENSHVKINVIGRIHESEVEASNYWSGPYLYTYVALRPGTDPKQIGDRLTTLIGKLGAEHPETKGTKVYLQPVVDIHLRSHFNDELESNGNEALIYVLAGIGVIVLLMAWINYVNIETARFIKRAREVGVRRIIGSGKRDLALQFLVEYSCVTVLALGLAVVLLQVIVPHIGYLTGVSIGTLSWPAPWICASALGAFLAGSLLAGTYPVLFLLNINPMEALKGGFSAPKGGNTIRKSLIIVQFTSSFVLVSFLLVILGQLDYMQLTNKKIDIDRVVSIRNPTVYVNDDDSINFVEYTALENKLLGNHVVKNMTSSSAIPGMEIDENFVNRIKRDLVDPPDPTRYKVMFVGYNFVPFYGLKLLAGRNYSAEQGDEENWNKVILNETAIRMLGFPSVKDAIDQDINFHLWGGKFQKYRIIGIVEDYHHEAIKKAISPTILSLNHDRFQQVFYSVKLNAGTNPHDGLAIVEKCWKQVFPDKPFEYWFQDDYYDRQFKSERYFGRIFGLFAGVAVFIACLGILGLTLFEANSRSKELSIRKVLGATVTGLLVLLSKGYFKLIFLAAAIAIPVVYYFASQWLMNYPSRIEFNPLFVILPLASVIALVTLTSGIHTFRAATANPVEHLKNE